MDPINTITRLIEVLEEYGRPLCLTFIELKNSFDSIEIEAVMETLVSQGVPTQRIRIVRELYKNFTTQMSPFYNDINIVVKRGVRQGDTISPKLSTATTERHEYIGLGYYRNEIRWSYVTSYSLC